MQRREFIADATAAISTAAATVATATLSASATASQIAQTNNPPTGRNAKSVVVKVGKDRFDQPILFRGKNPNLVKVSAKDTNGQLTVMEYEGFEKDGPALHVHLNQDEVFYIRKNCP